MEKSIAQLLYLDIDTAYTLPKMASRKSFSLLVQRKEKPLLNEATLFIKLGNRRVFPSRIRILK